MNKTNHLPFRQRLKYVQPIWTIKYRRLCTIWENTSKKILFRCRQPGPETYWEDHEPKSGWRATSYQGNFFVLLNTNNWSALTLWNGQFIHYSITKDNYSLPGYARPPPPHPGLPGRAWQSLRETPCHGATGRQLSQVFVFDKVGFLMFLLLRDFLINPSDILTQLYSSGQKTAGLNHPEIKGVTPIYIYTARWMRNEKPTNS